jgi:hypothetical protein
MQIAEAMDLAGEQLIDQRDSIMAVANRLLERDDYRARGDELILEAKSIKRIGSTARKPMAMWQAKGNKLVGIGNAKEG